MVITCASCETRFQVADGRIPAKGAWVRCSRCHHRFLVTPSPDEAGSPAGHEDSALEESGGSTETDLDNPQFLFERNETPGETGETGERLELSETTTPTSPGLRQQFPDEADAALGVQDPLAGLDEEIKEEGEGDSFEALTAPIGHDGVGSEEQSFAGIGVEEPPTRASSRGPDLSLLPDLDDEPDDSWDTMTAMELPSSASGGSAFERAESATRRERSEPSPAAPELSPRGADLESFTLRVLAVVVAVALSAGGVRAVVLHGLGDVRGPETVDSDGWQAAELQAYRLSDDAGRPVLVVRGKLYRNGRAPAPRVLATLLDQSGRPIGDPTPAALVRLEDEELAPAALGERLVAYDDWVRSEAPAIVRGFTVLVPEPPQRARRYRLELIEPPA